MSNLPEWDCKRTPLDTITHGQNDIETISRIDHNGRQGIAYRRRFRGKDG